MWLKTKIIIKKLNYYQNVLDEVKLFCYITRVLSKVQIFMDYAGVAQW